MRLRERKPTSQCVCNLIKYNEVWKKDYEEEKHKIKLIKGDWIEVRMVKKLPL